MNIILCTREEESRELAHGALICTHDEAEYLMHFGIKGQKKGIRRWQNEDGSLTPEGYIHYGVGQGNKHQQKSEKLDPKIEKAQAKYDKAMSKTVGIFGKNQRRVAKAESARMKLEGLKAKKRVEDRKAKEQEERGQKAIERDKEKEEFIKRNTLTEEDKISIKEHDDAGTEFTGNDEHDNALRNVSEKAIKEKIQSTKDWYNDEVYVDRREREVNLKYDIDSYNSGKMSDKERKDFGDDVLSYAHEISNEIESKLYPGGKWDSTAFEKMKDTDEYKTYDTIQNWITDQVYEKSGSWNAGAYKKGSNAEKASKKYEEAFYNLWEHSDGVARDKGIKDDRKLRELLKKDTTYQKLDKAYSEAEGDLLGAMLKDLGFRDTPENRYILLPFAFID